MIQNKHILTLVKKLIRKILKNGHAVRISKYKKIFMKGYVPNLCGEVFVITEVKNTVR